MNYDFPNDDDGDALRRLLTGGSDLSRLMYVNFQVAVPDEAAAKGLAEVAWKLGYRVEIYSSPECSLPWTCECSTRTLASYEAIIEIQMELRRISTPFGGFPDGWGSFGNATDETHTTD
ncbi:MAG: ribonuclease E inhibitor RraB [Planctomycetales bacterium]